MGFNVDGQILKSKNYRQKTAPTTKTIDLNGSARPPWYQATDRALGRIMKFQRKVVPRRNESYSIFLNMRSEIQTVPKTDGI